MKTLRVINNRRAVLNERMRALDELGIPDVVWYADTVDQMQTLADLALALYADTVGATQPPSTWFAATFRRSSTRSRCISTPRRQQTSAVFASCCSPQSTRLTASPGAVEERR